MTACYDNPSDSPAVSHLPLHKGGIKEGETCGAPSLYWGRLVRFGETYAVLSPFAGGRLERGDEAGNNEPPFSKEGWLKKE